MSFYLNELSLHNQFASLTHFNNSLKVVLNIRRELINNDYLLLFCNKLKNRFIYSGKNFKTVFEEMTEDNIKRSIRIWLSSAESNWESVRLHDDKDTFIYNEENIINYSLAEISSRILCDTDCTSISFAPSDLCSNPLIIEYHIEGKKNKDINITNFWSILLFRTFLKGLEKKIDSWEELSIQIIKKFPNFKLLDSFQNNLEGCPFNESIANRTLELMFILDDYRESLNEDNSRSEESNKIYEQYFKRKNAIFTDASSTEKRDPIYKKKMTFKDPKGNDIECFNHGKIKQREFRLHYSTPITKKGNNYIAYLGEKLTKK